MRRWLGWFGGVVTGSMVGGLAEGPVTTLDTEHIDVLIRYVPESTNRLELAVRDSTADRVYATNEVVIRSAAPARLTLPAGTPFGEEGESIWVLPQSQDPALPYLGFATDGVPLGVYEGALRYRLRRVEGPGEFFLWQAGMGGINVQMSTVDGIGEGDEAVLAAGGHAHYNWGFTQPGMYCVTLQAVGRRVGVSTNDMSVETPITFYIEPMPLEPYFEVWQRQHWPTCVPQEVRGPGADPDGDGWVNAVEYALGLDPLEPDEGGRPEGVWVDVGGIGYPALAFTRVKAAADLTYEVFAAPTLTWEEERLLAEVVSVEDHGETETVVVRDTEPVEPGSARFLQLRVRWQWRGDGERHGGCRESRTSR